MNTTKSSVWQVVALCAVIGCGVVGFVALIELAKVQELQRKLKDGESELEFARMIPGWKQLVSRQQQLRQKNPDHFKQTEEMLRQSPVRSKEYRETTFRTQLSNIVARVKELPAGTEATTLMEITNALAQLHELELNPEDMLTITKEMALARGAVGKDLDRLREQYVDIRLRELAEGLGRHDPGELEKFVADVRRVYADTDTLIGPRRFALASPAKPATNSPAKPTIPWQPSRR
jgi:hypothetical protein